MDENNLETLELTIVDSQENSSYLQKQIKRLQERIRILEEENLDLLGRIRELKAQTKRLDERVFDLFTISQAGKVFTGTPDTMRLAEILLSMVTERLGLKKVVLLLSKDEANFRYTHSIGLDRDKIKHTVYRKKEGLFWQLIANADPFPVVDIEGSLRFPSIFQENQLTDLQSSTWIPMKTKNRAIGIITLEEQNLEYPEMQFLTQLAGQAAVAFETAFLYQAIEDSRKELDRQMHNLSILYDIGKAMNFIDDLTKLLVLILDQAIEVVEAAKGSLMLLDERRDELIVRVVRGIEKSTEEKILRGEIDCTRIKLGEGIAGRVAKTGEPLLITDATTDTRFLASKMSNVQNLMCVPLKVYDDTIGVINMSNKKNNRPFTPDDLQIITTLASQAAVAINNARLYEMAVTDGLTKLFIRRHFMQKFDEELRRARRYSHEISLLMIDIDHFKNLNDTYGHQAGDLVLIEVAKIFKQKIRSTDFACRYGGEEFCILLPETGTTGAKVIAERLRHEVDDMRLTFENRDITCTVSIGVATFPRDANDTKDIIRKADLALYTAKEAGRNQVVSFSPEDKNQITDEFGKETAVLELPEVETLSQDSPYDEDD